MHRAMSKTWRLQKSQKLWKLFSNIFKSEFLILAIAQNWKLGNKKTRSNISEISNIFEVFEFLICHFRIFKKIFFLVFYNRQFGTFYINVMYCFQSLLKSFLLQQKKYNVQDITMLLWNKCIYTKTPVFLNKLLKKALYCIDKETCINMSFFIYGIFVYLTWGMATWRLLIWNSTKDFNLSQT